MESKKKRKFNAVDVIFILIVLAGLAFVLLRFTGLGSIAGLTGESAAESYIITFSGDEVPNFVIERIEAGDPLTDDACQLDLGTVVDLEVSDAVSYNANDAGELVVSSKPNNSSIKLMGEVQATDNGNGITIDGNSFGVGHTMVVRAGDAKMYLVVYDIQKKDDSAYAENG